MPTSESAAEPHSVVGSDPRACLRENPQANQEHTSIFKKSTQPGQFVVKVCAPSIRAAARCVTILAI